MSDADSGIPSLDLMRDAAKAKFKQMGWGEDSRLSPHSVIGLMAAFALEIIKTGEGQCGWPRCGCDWDAVCNEVVTLPAPLREDSPHGRE